MCVCQIIKHHCFRATVALADVCVFGVQTADVPQRDEQKFLRRGGDTWWPAPASQAGYRVLQEHAGPHRPFRVIGSRQQQTAIMLHGSHDSAVSRRCHQH